MCRIFSESFAIINSNFKSIFVELFGGGKAELILTDPENVLESGIEISVAPPGKVIKNLISLSGGEQSFVAIAIYFAVRAGNSQKKRNGGGKRALRCDHAGGRYLKAS